MGVIKKSSIRVMTGGGLIGILLLLTVYPGADWSFITVAGLMGALLGLAPGRVFGRKVLELISKYSGQDWLVRGAGVLTGMLGVVFLTLIFRSELALITLPSRTALLFMALLISTGMSLLICSVKIKELSTLLFPTERYHHPAKNTSKNALKILDTSAIIDGRIADLCKTGFLEGVLIIPNFVLAELQRIADSGDQLRRNRGRRGLEILNRIQKENQVAVRIFDQDYEDLNEVDTKLLKLARELDAKVVTNDFNLNKVAELYGVSVLNINELSNAIKPVVLPGEEMSVRILRDGKESGQGIGYLEDGTMVVVESARGYIGMEIGIFVTSVLQTSAGRMIFAKPKDYGISSRTSS